MRKGCLWAAGTLLAMVAPAMAQDGSIPSQPGQPGPHSLPPAVAAPTPLGITDAPAPNAPLACFNEQPAQSLGFWVTTDYLLWWVKSGPIIPVVTTSNNFTTGVPGAVNQPGTHVLYGNSPIDYGTFSGLRIGAGVDIGCGLVLEGNYFALETRPQNFSVASNANGSPLIGIPFFSTRFGVEDALLTSNSDRRVGVWSGATEVASHSQLQGWELNLAAPRQTCGDMRFTGIAGLRVLNLNEDFSIMNQFTPQAGGVLTFLGVPVPGGTRLTDMDSFHTGNTFYGGQVGGRLEWQRGIYSLNLIGKVALGDTQEILTIDGHSSSTPPGGPTTTVPGGIYAQTTNIGRFYHNEFAVVPEVNLNLGVALTDRVTARIGYSFLYWSRVARPGDQIDHTLNPSLIPTDQFFGTGPAGGHPIVPFRQTDFWAQGINFGLEFTF